MNGDIPFAVALMNDGILVAAILAVAAALVLVALDRRLVGAAKAGWILAILLVPVLGPLAYFVVALSSRWRKEHAPAGKADPSR